MQKTTSLQRLGHGIAALVGWRVHVDQSPPERCVIVGAHHTSNWDLFPMLLMMAAADIKMNWVAKDTLFRGPLGRLLAKMGGIPVDRRNSSGFVEQMIGVFRQGGPFRLGVAPEGTRSQVRYWRTGFYHIAVGAAVPIVLGYADYKRRVVGLGPIIQPTGAIQVDFKQIAAFYSTITAKAPLLQGGLRLRDDAT